MYHIYRPESSKGEKICPTWILARLKDFCTFEEKLPEFAHLGLRALPIVGMPWQKWLFAPV